jgi:hypothetical protein
MQMWDRRNTRCKSPEAGMSGHTGRRGRVALMWSLGLSGYETENLPEGY